MSVEIFTAVVAIAVSLLFEYVPGLSDWYNKIQDKYQRLLMLGLMVLLAFGALGLNCIGWFTSYIPKISCSQAGVEEVFVLLLTALVSNQTAHLVLKKN
jgi:hypothetical protein